LVSEPVNLNSFSATQWNLQTIITSTVGNVCQNPPSLTPTSTPTASPTIRPTRNPASLPTLKPTVSSPSFSPTALSTGLKFNQVDLTFLIDRSESMNWRNQFCLEYLTSFPPVQGFSGKPSISACWELYMRYVLQQVDLITAVMAGPNGNEPLNWASSYPNGTDPPRGLRVNLIGFACTDHQKKPLVFPYSLKNGGIIVSRAQLVSLLDLLRTTVVPHGGTCPGLAIEQAVLYIEETTQADYPLQSTILMTDGVFYDMPYPSHAVTGLQAYKSLRFAVGIAVAKSGNNYGLTPEEIIVQKQQLNEFVAPYPNFFKSLDNEGWSLINQVANEIALDLPVYYTQGANPLPRYEWCGWRRITWCAYQDYRFGHCKWWHKIPKTGSWGCSRKP